MNLLLDTHTFLWIVNEPSHLSATAQAACQDRHNLLVLSTASIWEIQVKHQIGKLTLPDALESIIQEQQLVNGIRVLLIEPRHIYALAALPHYHKDPFDRLLLAQASAEQLTVVTADPAFAAYGLPLLW